MRLRTTVGSSAAAGVAVLVAVPLAAGWVGARTTTESQAPPIGAVTLQATICPGNQDLPGSLQDCGPGNSNPPNNGGWFNGSPGQAMVGFRVPVQADPPDALSVTQSRAGQVGGISSNAISTPAFIRNAGYESELERLAPTPPDQRWVGYLSSEFSASAADDVATLGVSGTFILRPGADGGPFVRPFRSRTVVGGRQTGGNPAPESPVACGNSLTQPSGVTICAQTPDAATLLTDEQLDTRDLGILAGGASVAAAPGALATLPFTLAYSGLPQDQAVFSLTASTGLPGATTEVSPSSFTPGTDERRPVTVSVTVPRGAQIGEYDVLLTARAGQDVRTAKGKLTVVQGRRAAVSIGTAKATVRWTRSRSRGFVQVEGTTPLGGPHTALLVKRGSRITSRGRAPAVTRSVTRRFSVNTGAFRRRIPLPSGFVPGSYAVAISPAAADGTALARATKGFRLAPPREGVVQEAYPSGRKNGARVTRFRTRPRIVFANFTFAPGAQPLRRTRAQRRKHRITVQWFRGSRPVGKRLAKPNRRKVSSFLRLSNRRPLPGGRYRAVMKAGTKVVARVDLRIG